MTQPMSPPSRPPNRRHPSPTLNRQAPPHPAAAAVDHPRPVAAAVRHRRRVAARQTPAAPVAAAREAPPVAAVRTAALVAVVRTAAPVVAARTAPRPVAVRRRPVVVTPRASGPIRATAAQATVAPGRQAAVARPLQPPRNRPKSLRQQSPHRQGGPRNRPSLRNQLSPHRQASPLRRPSLMAMPVVLRNPTIPRSRSGPTRKPGSVTGADPRVLAAPTTGTRAAMAGVHLRPPTPAAATTTVTPSRAIRPQPHRRTPRRRHRCSSSRCTRLPRSPMNLTQARTPLTTATPRTPQPRWRCQQVGPLRR